MIFSWFKRPVPLPLDDASEVELKRHVREICAKANLDNGHFTNWLWSNGLEAIIKDGQGRKDDRSIDVASLFDYWLRVNDARNLVKIAVKANVSAQKLVLSACAASHLGIDLLDAGEAGPSLRAIETAVAWARGGQVNCSDLLDAIRGNREPIRNDFGKVDSFYVLRAANNCAWAAVEYRFAEIDFRKSIVLGGNSVADGNKRVEQAVDYMHGISDKFHKPVADAVRSVISPLDLKPNE